MEKFIPLILLVIFFGVGAARPSIQEEIVTLSVRPNVFNRSELPEAVEVTMINNTREVVTAGLDYWIEYYEDVQWVRVSPEQTFEDVGYNFSPSVFYTYEKLLFTEEIDYKVGKYRIVKYYSKPASPVSKEEIRVYAEFRVREMGSIESK